MKNYAELKMVSSIGLCADGGMSMPYIARVHLHVTQPQSPQDKIILNTLLKGNLLIQNVCMRQFSDFYKDVC